MYAAARHRQSLHRVLPPLAQLAHACCRPKAEWRFRDVKLRLFKCLHRDEGVGTVVEVGECCLRTTTHAAARKSSTTAN